MRGLGLWRLKTRVGHSHLEFARAGLMARHQGQRHQQLILDQFGQAELPAADQQVLLDRVVLLSSQGLGVNKTEPSVNHRLPVQGLQTALAGQGQTGRDLEMQPSLAGAARVGTQATFCRPAKRPVGPLPLGFNQQPWVMGQPTRPVQSAIVSGKRLRIEGSGWGVGWHARSVRESGHE